MEDFGHQEWIIGSSDVIIDLDYYDRPSEKGLMDFLACMEAGKNSSQDVAVVRHNELDNIELEAFVEMEADIEEKKFCFLEFAQVNDLARDVFYLETLAEHDSRYESITRGIEVCSFGDLPLRDNVAEKIEEIEVTRRTCGRNIYPVINLADTTNDSFGIKLSDEDQKLVNSGNVITDYDPKALPALLLRISEINKHFKKPDQSEDRLDAIQDELTKYNATYGRFGHVRPEDCVFVRYKISDFIFGKHFCYSKRLVDRYRRIMVNFDYGSVPFRSMDPGRYKDVECKPLAEVRSLDDVGIIDMGGSRYKILDYLAKGVPDEEDFGAGKWLEIGKFSKMKLESALRYTCECKGRVLTPEGDNDFARAFVTICDSERLYNG